MITEIQSFFSVNKEERISNCLSTVNLFPLKQNRITFMNNNTKLKSRKINFLLFYTRFFYKELSFWVFSKFPKIGPTFTSKVFKEFLIPLGSWDMIQNSIYFVRYIAYCTSFA